MNTISIKPIGSGLNNQRFALMGLAVWAKANDAKVILPNDTVDFSPNTAGRKKIYLCCMPLMLRKLIHAWKSLTF